MPSRALRWCAVLLACLSGAPLSALSASADVVVPDTTAQRVLACAARHGKEGLATDQGYFPRIAGKPRVYFYNQLVGFRDGRRSNRTMNALTANMSDAYLMEIAAYFAALDLPYAAPSERQAPAREVERGRMLVHSGDAAKRLPACTQCHGSTLTGVVPAVPALVGLSKGYLLAQFGGEDSSVVAIPELIERGAYLARAGTRSTCHTIRGGAAFAGARAIETPFGTVYSSNLTPDRQSGIGAWSAGAFWRAMHNGRSKDGRLLYPAFPYPNFTEVRRADSDAIFAFLRTQPPAMQPNLSHDLRFPYNSQAALAVWRALYFRAQVFEPDEKKSTEWNRGAYLVRGLGHCIACHSTRNALGATEGRVELGGGLIPVKNWYAPSLVSPTEAGVAHWDAEAAPEPQAPDPASIARGQRLYEDRCVNCHGAQGQGACGAYPALAGNRKLTMRSASNMVRVVVEGGFAPTTAGDPRPFGMPPFGPSLNSAEVADVVTHVRNAWGNRAGPTSELDVVRSR